MYPYPWQIDRCQSPTDTAAEMSNHIVSFREVHAESKTYHVSMVPRSTVQDGLVWSTLQPPAAPLFSSTNQLQQSVPYFSSYLVLCFEILQSLQYHCTSTVLIKFGMNLRRCYRTRHVFALIVVLLTGLYQSLRPPRPVTTDGPLPALYSRNTVLLGGQLCQVPVLSRLEVLIFRRSSSRHMPEMEWVRYSHVASDFLVLGWFRDPPQIPHLPCRGCGMLAQFRQ